MLGPFLGSSRKLVSLFLNRSQTPSICIGKDMLGRLHAGIMMTVRCAPRLAHVLYVHKARACPNVWAEWRVQQVQGQSKLEFMLSDSGFLDGGLLGGCNDFWWTLSRDNRHSGK